MRPLRSVPNQPTLAKPWTLCPTLAKQLTLRTTFLAAVMAATIASIFATPDPARAQASPSQDAGHLAPLAFLAGSCWKGTFPGGTVTDEHCYEWMYGTHFLKDRHVVRGEAQPYEGETTFAWNAQKNQIVFWYAALPGFYTEGTVRTSGQTLSFTEEVITAGAAPELKTTWTRNGSDSYTVRTVAVTNGAEREVRVVEMKRVSAAN
jgi:hypothetical protein